MVATGPNALAILAVYMEESVAGEENASTPFLGHPSVSMTTPSVPISTAPVQVVTALYGEPLPLLYSLFF